MTPPAMPASATISALAACFLFCAALPMNARTATEIQVTRGPGGRILTNTAVWSPDSQWIVYDTRSDAAGEIFDGDRIEMVHVGSGEVRLLYESRHGARCGVATFHPREWRVVFILGPEHPEPGWQYNAYHRQGVLVDTARPGIAAKLDARDLVPPFTPGALRGGSHVHVWDPAGERVSFTYEDHLLTQFSEPGPGHDINQRNVGVCVPVRPVRVPTNHPRNHHGEFFTVLVTRTTACPRPGSDEILKACEEGWVGRNALAFQGQVIAETGETISEVFLVTLPDDLTQPGAGPLAGTATRMPFPPRGVTQRRLTFTADRKYPGIQGPRHWLRAAPDGSRIAFFMKDEAGVAQIWTVAPDSGPPRQLTRNPWPVASAFTWSPNGRHIAHVMDNSVCMTDGFTGETVRLTPRDGDDAAAPRPEACVFSPDGTAIAFLRRLPSPEEPANQICIVRLE